MTLRTTDELNEEPEDDAEDEESLDIEGWSIDGFTEKIRQWLEHNERKFLVDFEHPRVEVDQERNLSRFVSMTHIPSRLSWRNRDDQMFCFKDWNIVQQRNGYGSTKEELIDPSDVSDREEIRDTKKEDEEPEQMSLIQVCKRFF